jgi:hypothetical protein
MPEPILWQQDDRRWAGEALFLPRLETSLERVTHELHRLDRGEARTTRRIQDALAAFGREVMRRAGRGRRRRREAVGSMANVGCHVCCLSMVLGVLRVSLDGEEPTPLRLLRALQDEMLLSLTGFCWMPGSDLLGLVTEGEVTLTAYEDFGRPGVPGNRSVILRGLRAGTAAVVNVDTHEHLTHSDWTHYAVVVRRKGKRHVTLLDPGAKAPRTNSLLMLVPKVFQVFAYRRNPRR